MAVITMFLPYFRIGTTEVKQAFDTTFDGIAQLDSVFEDGGSGDLLPSRSGVKLLKNVIDIPTDQTYNYISGLKRLVVSMLLVAWITAAAVIVIAWVLKKKAKYIAGMTLSAISIAASLTLYISVPGIAKNALVEAIEKSLFNDTGIYENLLGSFVKETVLSYIGRFCRLLLQHSVQIGFWLLVGMMGAVFIASLVGLILECGSVNYLAMQLLNEHHIARFGKPEPTEVRVTPVAGRAILVSGHDLDDLEQLLIQTEGRGINVYTHGEMLPAHGYPGLKKYKHLVGNYGGAWQDQQKEFDLFPGAILMTTNCIQKPRPAYMDRIFTTGLVEYPGVRHVKNGEFGPVIEAALAQPGFPADEPEKKILVGFGHDAVASVAETVVGAVKAGKIRHFFLIGGCDGAKPGRNYYTELAEKVPQDCVILTLACGKYRFNKLEFGDIGGIPRLLDVGQCNDAYSAVRIASMLAAAFHCSINDLPLTIILSWYEQKAVAVLLTLLSLGVKNIKLGPSLPAFVSPATLRLLVEKFNIGPVTAPDEDIAAALK